MSGHTKLSAYFIFDSFSVRVGVLRHHLVNSPDHVRFLLLQLFKHDGADGVSCFHVKQRGNFVVNTRDACARIRALLSHYLCYVRILLGLYLGPLAATAAGCDGLSAATGVFLVLLQLVYFHQLAELYRIVQR